MRRNLLVPAAVLALPVAMLAQTGFDPGAGFGGPSVLGRSAGAGIGRRTQQVRFRPFITARGVYDTGLTASRIVGPDGEPAARDLYGYQLTAGVYGYKTWRRSQLSLGVVGGYRNYSNSGAFNGGQFTVSAGYSHQINKRLGFTTTNFGGTMNRAYGLGFGVITPGQGLDPSTDPLPVDEVYDNRINFFSTSNSMTYMFSPRLSVAATGGIFVNNRTNGLISAKGSMANGDVAYRLSRRQTVSMSYGYTQFNFDQQYGDSFMQILGAGYAIDFANRWRLQLRVIGYRMENEGLQRVTVDPEIARIIGISTTLEAFHRINYLPGYNAALTKSFRNMTAGVSYNAGITPGNGVYLTSRTKSANAYYSYTGIRKWNFNSRVAYLERQNILRFSGTSETISGGVGVGYQVRSDVQVSASADYRDQQSQAESVYGVRGWRYSIGISYSPGDIPLAIF